MYVVFVLQLITLFFMIVIHEQIKRFTIICRFSVVRSNQINDKKGIVYFIIQGTYFIYILYHFTFVSVLIETYVTNFSYYRHN